MCYTIIYYDIILTLSMHYAGVLEPLPPHVVGPAAGVLEHQADALLLERGKF